MVAVIDMSGYVTGKLTVLRRARRTGKAYWECSCECGVHKEISGSELRKGQQSCGCTKTAAAAAARRTHGMSRTPLAYLWKNIINRCERPETHNFYRYGGRGISVCHEWRRDATAFISWCLDNGYVEGLEIDRIDNDGDYGPDNCRFVDRKTNRANRSEPQPRTHCNRGHLFSGRSGGQQVCKECNRIRALSRKSRRKY